MGNIVVKLPDGSKKELATGATGLDLAKSIGAGLAKAAVAYTSNGIQRDLSDQLEDSSDVSIITIKSEEGLEIMRHTLTAQVLAQAVKNIYPDAKLAIGPTIDNGFYYDFYFNNSFSIDDLKAVEDEMIKIIKSKSIVTKTLHSKDEAISLFNDLEESFKAEIIADSEQTNDFQIYTQEETGFIDLCRGPHLPSLDFIGEFKLTHVSGAYWRGDSTKPMLTRIYGTAWNTKQELNDYLTKLEEAEKRDHRKLGKEMDLFHFQEEAPGMVFWHPSGWTIYTQLQTYIRKMQIKANYQEIKTPQVVDRKLWEKSGHWDKYRENMFITEIDEGHANEKRTNALKPMNCPCHVQVYNQGLKSYKDLPLRFAEFGSCHRYEPSGAMHGIMRVRGFVQDDAHIFCTEEQIESETKKFIELLSKIYTDLGFKDYKIKFSDRPEKRAGSDETWFKAEEALKNATYTAGYSFELNPGEGAFYGPKLEFVLTDAIGRDWQCGTLQVDFVLPQRLNANYIAMDGNKKNVVMLHRAILGSFERFIGILIEENSGKLPLWLTPTQVVIASVVSGANDYAKAIYQDLISKNIRAKLDIRNEKINYKIREHSLKKIPIIYAVGLREVENKTVTIRKLGSNKTSTVSFVEEIKGLIPDCEIPK